MASDFPTKKGIHKMTLTLENENMMRYAIYIPKSYSPERAVPLIIALHYGGRVTPYYGKAFLEILIEPALKDLSAIIVAPDCPAGRWDNPKSESAVIQLLDNIKNHYAIDDKKVVLTGFSMGGIGTWYIAARHPELFSAAIPISATASTEDISMIKDIPLYVIHSKDDEVIPYKPVQAIVEQLKSREYPVEIIILNDITHYETYRFVGPLKKAIPWLKKIWER
ncbi:MAG: hypothetical protein A2Y62_13755 [Candidatus Fischerbacteria bacterium RBG_13_37_8]|uniref:Phospholipase/carboxylesterase/thioesterase domain-containing protein n=1 Tax=Candidatus Fischerbacteria bacterium RBG_13_37_8 TaxID=1817863 RepID=A0A1F5V7F2_9BACT|nr:MAG: hypothetical protein A2Y62_13755 [Candidatus Fischerbacteria bacterium RBG_13_37_8]